MALNSAELSAVSALAGTATRAEVREVCRTRAGVHNFTREIKNLCQCAIHACPARRSTDARNVSGVLLGVCIGINASWLCR